MRGLCHMMNVRATASLLLATALIGCGTGAGIDNGQTSAVQDDYFDYSKCWTSGQKSRLFEGAIAFFKVDGGYYATIFSGICGPSQQLVSEIGDETLSIGGGNIQRSGGPIKSSSIYEYSPVVTVSKGQLDRIGISPQWPSALYAIRGELDAQIIEGRISKVNSLTLIQAQSIPREMYGIFLQYPDRRTQMIRYYLTETSLDPEGNKTNGI